MLQRLPTLKYYNVQKQESRFTLRLDAPKNMLYPKMLQIKVVVSTEFHTKRSVGTYAYHPQQ